MNMNKPDEYQKSPDAEDRMTSPAGLAGDPDSRTKDVIAQLAELEV